MRPDTPVPSALSFNLQQFPNSMQSINFTPKLLRQRGLFGLLFPLFALFVGLGSQVAKAAVVITSSSVYISTNGGTTNTTYTDASFDTAYLGTYDISAAQLVLNGGVINATESGTSNIGSAFIDYNIYDPSGNPVNGGSILLPSTGAASGSRTFSLANANVNLVNPVPSAATGYTISLVFRVQFRNGTTGPFSGVIRNDNGGFGYNATYDVTGTRPNPTSIGPPTNAAGTIFIGTPDNALTNSTYSATTGQADSFNGANLGTFDINTGRLILNGGTTTTNESNGDIVQGAQLYYRVFKNGQTPTGFLNFTLTQSTYNSTTGVRQFSITNQQRNLITSLANSGTGTYKVQVYYQADGQRANGNTFTLIDNNNGNNYTATFTTNGNPIQTDTWTGALDDNWFNPGNWDLGRIPDAITNVVIPNFATGNATPYPNIYSDQSYLNTPNPNVSTTRVTVNNAGSGPALARNLDLLGASSTIDRSILRLQSNSVLKIYGNFSNRFLSYITRDNSNTWFASSTSQNIDQGTYATLTVSGGGPKAIIGTVNVGEQFVFDSSAGNTIVTTDSQNPGTSYIQLADRQSVNNNQGAQLIGETDNSYVLGLIVTRRASVLANEGAPRTLGGIGFSFEFLGSSDPGDIDVTRSTVQNYFFSSTRISVRRVFGIRPSNLGRTGFNLRANVTFTVLPNETKNLSPNNGTIPEQNLVLFLSKNNGGTFGNLGRDGAVVNYTVTKSNVTDFATFTLGDQANPLPVRLTAFGAKRLGNDALVTWQTASEQNSKGYEVQVSTNGKEYRTLSFVASATPNSTGRTDYSYVDKEANKAGQRYYRLRQVDLDGKDAYFGPSLVSFEGKVSASAVAAYPNPIKGGEELHLATQSNIAGNAQVNVTDMTGRTIRQESVAVGMGLSDFTLSHFDELKTGMYMVRVKLPSGEVQTLKVVKQ
jgi:hypothetical protein